MLTEDNQYLLLLRPEDLESCEGQLTKLQEKIVEALQSFDLQVSKRSEGYVEAYPTERENILCEQDAVVPFQNSVRNS